MDSVEHHVFELVVNELQEAWVAALRPAYGAYRTLACCYGWYGPCEVSRAIQPSGSAPLFVTTEDDSAG